MNVIPMVLHNRTNYDYYLTIKEFPKEFEGQFECSGENRENGYFFQCQQRKKLKMILKMTCRTTFMDSVRLAASSLSCFTDNLAEGLYNST